MPVLLGLLVLLGHTGAVPHQPSDSAPAPAVAGGGFLVAPGPGRPDGGPAAPEVVYPQDGDADWVTAPAAAAPAGTAGPLLRYRVSVEFAIRGLAVPAFADEVSATLADPRGWTGTGRVRLQRVGPGAPADFAVYLATPGTRDLLCADGYDRYTSCRHGDRVVINVARWVHGGPAFGDLPAYRRYVVNHEVGHRLGHGDQRCPGAGRPAPVMQQQTENLHGCRPYPWPMLDGAAYAGPAGGYDDPVPLEPPDGW